MRIRSTITVLAKAFSIAAMLAGCASAPAASTPVPNWQNVKIDSLRTLADSSPAAAIDQALFLLEAPPGQAEVNRSALAAVITKAGDTLARRYAAARKAGDAASGLSALRSLGALASVPEALGLLSPEARGVAQGVAASAGLDEGTLLLDQAGLAWKQSNQSLANALVAEALNAFAAGNPQAKELLAPWRDRAEKAGSTSLVARIDGHEGSVDASVQASPPASERLDPALVAKIEPGVITVRVDRGIRVEQGMGSPDRVLGSGFFIDPRGYLITNYHVISSEVDPEYNGYSRVTIKPADNPDARIPAKVIGWDPILDLALLKAEMTPPYSFVLDPAPALEQGATIYALGSPLGLESTITSGIVSATGRNFLQWGTVIQVDAALNPGNSGGPLLDAAGKVSGIVFAGVPGYQGLNFAIPGTWLMRALPSLYAGGKVAHPWLGYVLDDAENGGTGLSVRYRSPSVLPSVREGDTILSIDGKALKKVTDLQAILLERHPGDLVRLRVRDAKGKERVVLRALGTRPEHPLDDAIAQDTHERIFPALMGMDVTRIPGGVFDGDSYSVSKVRPGSVADEAGLSEGDPFTLYALIVHPKDRAALVQIHIKKRKAGFLESIIQIPIPLDIPNFV